MRKSLHNFLLIKIIIFTFTSSFLIFFETKIYADLPHSLRIENLPTLQAGPPLNIQAAYDKEVLLEVTVADDFSSQNSKIVWSINNKKICTGLYCPIVLKESDYQNTVPILQIITYNEYGGTTYTYEFEIRSNEGFDSKSLNKETAYIKNTENYSNSNSFSTQSVSAIFGKGTLIQSDYILYIGSLSRSFNWSEGVFQTDNLDTLRIADSESGVWFLLPSSNLSIKSQSQNDNFRHAMLNFGNLRVKASGVKNDTDTNTESFNYKMEVQTPEVIVTVPRGGDLVMTRGKDNEKLFTRIIVFSGEVYLEPNAHLIKNPEKYKNGKISLGTGLEFKIYEDGKILPLSIPNNSTIENFIAFTTTQDELKERNQVRNIDNLSDILDRAALLADNEEYFELLNLLTPIQNQMKRDIRIPYYLGFAKKGLYQTQEAKKYFLISREMDTNFPMAHWQLGLIYLEEKNYHFAENEFLLAHKNLPLQSKVAHEYEYYIGVPYFFNNKLVLAKNSFQSAVWDTELDPSLRQSAADFLRKINIEKPWSLIVPIGVQYDNNVLSIAQNQSLPSQYSQKSDFRSIVGALYTYDSSKENKDNGWFLGGGGKSFYVKNYPSTYSLLDAIVLEGSIYETYRWDKDEVKKEKDSVRVYQTAGDIIVNNQQDTIYFLGGGVYKTIDLNAGVQFDISNRPVGEKKSGLVYNQYYQMGFGQYGAFVLDLMLQAQEQLMFQTSDTVGNTFEVIATPSATYSMNSKANLKFGNTFDFLYTFISPIQSTYKFIPTVALNYFFYDWLIGTLSGSFEYDRVLPDNSNVYRPGASLMFTGIF
jgi:tetratricopeptide (TPR) repeat protein